MPSGFAALLQELLEEVLPSRLSTKTKTSGTPRVLPRRRQARAATRRTGGSLERNLRMGGLQEVLQEDRQPTLLRRDLQRQRPKGPEPPRQATAAPRGARPAPAPSREGGAHNVSRSTDLSISPTGATAAIVKYSVPRACASSSAANRAGTPSARAAGDCSAGIRRWSAGGIARKSSPRQTTPSMVMP